VNYTLKKGVPVFLDDLRESSEGLSVDSLDWSRSKGWISLRRIFGAPKANLTQKPRVLKKMVSDKDSLTLNIGSSSKKAYPNSINLDIGLFNGVDVVADGKALPFEDGSFDNVLIECVLEHIDEAEKVINESYRVLKKGGRIFVSLPFMFVFHGSPDDYNRYTMNGLIRRFELAGFKVERTGLSSGPGSTLSQTLRYFFANLFSFGSRTLYSIGLHVFGWLTFWIRYFDLVLNNTKKGHVLGNVIWAVGQK